MYVYSKSNTHGPVLANKLKLISPETNLLVKLLRNVLKRMKNQFFDFHFLSYDRFCSQFSSIGIKWKKKMPQKMRYVLKHNFVFMSFFCAISSF